MLANAVNTHMKGSKQEPAVRPDEIAKVLSLGGNAAKAIAWAPIEEERETKEASRQKKSVVQPAAGLSPESLGTADDAPTFWDSNELEAHLDKQKKQDYLETEWPFGGLFHHGNKSSGNSSDSSTNSSSNSTSSSSLTTSEEGDGSQETNSTSSDNSTSSTNSSDLMGPSNSSISSSASNASSSNNASTALLEVHIAESSLGGLCRVGAHDGAEDDQGIAEVGAPCLFGLVEEDEGRHCIRGRRPAWMVLHQGRPFQLGPLCCGVSTAKSSTSSAGRFAKRCSHRCEAETCTGRVAPLRDIGVLIARDSHVMQ